MSSEPRPSKQGNICIWRPTDAHSFQRFELEVFGKLIKGILHGLIIRLQQSKLPAGQNFYVITGAVQLWLVGNEPWRFLSERRVSSATTLRRSHALVEQQQINRHQKRHLQLDWEEIHLPILLQEFGGLRAP